MFEGEGFRLAVDDAVEKDMRVQILAREGRTFALISPEVAALPGIGDATGEHELRAALAAAGEEMNGADHLFFLPEALKAELRATTGPAHVRRLTLADEAAFALFEAAAPEADFDEAFVELGHWVAFGAFDGDTLVAAGSAYPFEDDSLLADIGVVTLPGSRRQGHGRALVHALSRHALAEGFEPQYRCQLDNASSVAIARRAGFVSLGTWDVSAPDDEADDDTEGS